LWRVPGLGTKAVESVLRARRWRRLRLEDVGRLTVSIAKIRPFIIAEGWSPGAMTDMEHLRASLAPKSQRQLELFA
jgi:predicted DNA-binding helix-hairpin-helix protein